MDLIHQIEHNPELGAKITGLHFFIAFFIQIFDGNHVNPIIMDILQAGAWFVAIVVGCLTALSYIKKIFFSKNNRHGN